VSVGNFNKYLIRMKVQAGTLAMPAPIDTWGRRAIRNREYGACDEEISTKAPEIQVDSVDGNTQFFHSLCF
jgi:hypothetical protein